MVVPPNSYVDTINKHTNIQQDGGFLKYPQIHGLFMVYNGNTIKIWMMKWGSPISGTPQMGIYNGYLI